MIFSVNNLIRNDVELYILNSHEFKFLFRIQLMVGLEDFQPGNSCTKKSICRFDIFIRTLGDFISQTDEWSKDCVKARIIPQE